VSGKVPSHVPSVGCYILRKTAAPVCVCMNSDPVSSPSRLELEGISVVEVDIVNGIAPGKGI